MAESVDPQHDSVSRQALREVAPLIVPWSSRESFTQDVCGFPATQRGCWRCETVREESVKLPALVFPGISPRVASAYVTKAWVVFRLKDGIKAEVSAGPPDVTESNWVAFGYAESIPSQGFRPICIESPLSGWEQDEASWAKDQPSREPYRASLSKVFGRDAFKSVQVQGSNLEASLADMINAALDVECSFRRDAIKQEFGRESGIALCKIELTLARAGWLASDRGLFLTFSYFDPNDFLVKRLKHLTIPSSVPEGTVSRLLPLYNDFARLDNLSQTGTFPLHSVSFADSLCSKGRRNILPDEVGQSFLRFQIGEIVPYLLHWVLLRIMSHACEQNQHFVELFHRWRLAFSMDGSGKSGALFSELLGSSVIVPVDPNVIETCSAIPQNARGQLAVFDDPTCFRDVIASLGLSDKEVLYSHESALDFLRTDSSLFAGLPMYQDLSWFARGFESPYIRNGFDPKSFHDDGSLESLIIRIAFGAGLDGGPGAGLVCQAHVERCVFPIAHVLTHWDRSCRVTDYLIFPIWEELITTSRHEAQEFRPVIFAHLFVNLSRDQTPTMTSNEVTRLQSAITPLGHSIAHSYYGRVAKYAEEVESAWGQTSGWAHEVKNYCAPTVDDMSNLLRRWDNIRDADRKEKINHARRAILILNVCSYAVQLALSDRVGTSLQREHQKLTRLDSVYGQETVEAVLEFLLHHRRSTIAFREEIALSWEPFRPIEDVLAKLYKLFDARNEEELLRRRGLIWIVALLREVVWNIRNRAHVETPAPITITHTIVIQDSRLLLHIYQEQQESESPEGYDPANTPGIGSANMIFQFEKGGAGFGKIDGLAPTYTYDSSRELYQVRYHWRVQFAI